jgi:hypothetical protein
LWCLTYFYVTWVPLLGYRISQWDLNPCLRPDALFLVTFPLPQSKIHTHTWDLTREQVSQHLLFMIFFFRYLCLRPDALFLITPLLCSQKYISTDDTWWFYLLQWKTSKIYLSCKLEWGNELVESQINWLRMTITLFVMHTSHIDNYLESTCLEGIYKKKPIKKTYKKNL